MTGTSSTSRDGVTPTVGIGDDEADPVTDPQQVDDGGIGDAQRHRRGPGVAAEQPARQRAHPRQRLAPGHRRRQGATDHGGRSADRAVGHGLRARTGWRSGRPAPRTSPPARSRAAVQTVTVSGGGGAAAWRPTSTALPAQRAASSRRWSSTRRRSRRTRRRSRPSGPGGGSAFMAPEGRPIRPAVRAAIHSPGRGAVRRGSGGGGGRRAGELEDPEDSTTPRTRRSRRSRSCSRTRSSRRPWLRSSRRSWLRVRLAVLLARLAAAVVAVEAGALEDHADGVEHLAQPALALGAHGQRVVGEALHGLEEMAAVGAGVLIGGHWCPPGVTRARGWHSSSSTANATAQCLT